MRKRQRQVKGEEDAPALVQAAAHAEPLVLLALVKSHHGMLVCAQLCDPQGAALLSFIHVPPRVPRPFAGAPVHSMTLTHVERLRAVGCGLKGKLVRLLSLGTHCTTTSTTTAATSTFASTSSIAVSMTTSHQTRYFEPQPRNWRACHKLMQSCVRRVASKPMAAVRDEAAKDAEKLCTSGQCAAAVVALQLAIHLGDLPSRALKAWLLLDGREGVAEDQNEAFKLAEEGARWGCHHCQGVLAYCFWGGYGCVWRMVGGGYGCVEDKARSLKFARESAGRGSKYGQYVLGWAHQRGGGGLAVDNTQALAFYRLAAAQGLDEAQYEIGDAYRHGCGVALDHAEALRWYQRAAAQGYAQALFMVAYCHEVGEGVRKSKDNVGEEATREDYRYWLKGEAIRWYTRAQAAGHPLAAAEVRRLRAYLNERRKLIATLGARKGMMRGWYTSHVARHTSHVTRHTSHVTRRAWHA
jgi:TPR repeat protein